MWSMVCDVLLSGIGMYRTDWIDALPGIGHACGHNLIAMASISGALATKEVMEREDLGGKVVIFGTPAEEGLSFFYCFLLPFLCFLEYVICSANG